LQRLRNEFCWDLNQFAKLKARVEKAYRLDKRTVRAPSEALQKASEHATYERLGNRRGKITRDAMGFY
jgi:hypothetical protein